MPNLHPDPTTDEMVVRDHGPSTATPRRPARRGRAVLRRLLLDDGGRCLWAFGLMSLGSFVAVSGETGCPVCGSGMCRGAQLRVS